MSYYGDIREELEMNQDRLAKYPREYLKTLLNVLPAEWPVDIRDIRDFELETYLGLKKRLPLTNWDRFSIKEG